MADTTRPDFDYNVDIAELEEEVRDKTAHIAKLEREKGQLEGQVSSQQETIRKLEDWKADVIAAHEKVMSDECPSDERHCTCVPVLRIELEGLRAVVEKQRKSLDTKTH